MKKIIILGITLLLTCGCGKINEKKISDEFISQVNSSKGYKTNAIMEIINDEEKYIYDVEVTYKKDNLFKVSLINQTNNHEQIILKNTEGVYVVTPTLNKSFKFQSEWPFNSSQSYLITSLANDIKNDDKIEFEELKDGYTLTVDVNYPNNNELKYEKLIFDKDLNLKSVNVFDEADKLKITVNFSNIDYKVSHNDNHFDISSIIDEENELEENKEKPENQIVEETPETERTTNQTIENIIYPLYIPTDTYLQAKETIDTNNGQRVILTFGGEKSFVIVEETVSKSEEFEVIPVYGDPYLLNDSLIAISGNALTWTTNDMEYYISSYDLSKEELLSVASSLNNTSTVLKEGK